MRRYYSSDSSPTFLLGHRPFFGGVANAPCQEGQTCTQVFRKSHKVIFCLSQRWCKCNLLVSIHVFFGLAIAHDSRFVMGESYIRLRKVSIVYDSHDMPWQPWHVLVRKAGHHCPLTADLLLLVITACHVGRTELTRSSMTWLVTSCKL